MPEQTNTRQPRVRSASCRPPDYYNLLVETLGKLKPSLIRFAYNILRDKGAAGDVYTEVSILTLRAGERDNIDSYDEQLLSSFIHKIALNRCIDHNRSWNLRRHTELSDLMVAKANPETEVIYGDMIEAILRALERLPEEQRVLINLCYIERMERTEAAKRLGITASTVAGRLHRGTRSLREQLELSGYGDICHNRFKQKSRANRARASTASTPPLADH